MSDAVHPTARAGFGRAGADYERGRPSYPDAAVAALADSLGIGPGRRVLEIAAGTGKLTALLIPLGAELIAVEPVAAMRERLDRSLPSVRALDGTAERIPLASTSVDAVVVAQAFHWFDSRAASAEIHRVLRPGGGLGVLWNVWEQSVPWVARVLELAHAHVGDAPQQRTSDWADVLSATGLFTPLQENTFPHVVRGNIDTLRARIASTSYIAALDDAERAGLLAAITAIVAEDAETAGGQPLAMPYTTHVTFCKRSSVR